MEGGRVRNGGHKIYKNSEVGLRSAAMAIWLKPSRRKRTTATPRISCGQSDRLDVRSVNSRWKKTRRSAANVPLRRVGPQKPARFICSCMRATGVYFAKNVPSERNERRGAHAQKSRGCRLERGERCSPAPPPFFALLPYPLCNGDARRFAAWAAKHMRAGGRWMKSPMEMIAKPICREETH